MKEAGYNPPKDTSFKEDNLDAATRMFIEGPGAKKGEELLKTLSDFKRDILAVDSSVGREFANSLPLDLSMPKTQNKENKTWQSAYFHMTPTIAALTILSKFQNDVKNSEAQIVEYCHKKIGEVALQYDQFDAIAQSSSSYLMPEEELVITAGVAAYASSAKPTITVDGAPTTALPGGGYEYKTKVSSPGTYSKRIHYSFQKPDGTTATADKEVKYTVGQPAGLVVSTDKTRVFYQGCPNELSVIGAGGAEKISLDVQGPGVTTTNKGAGVYGVDCKSLGVATVTASDGKNNVKITIPIKPVPLPVIKVGNLTPGPVASNIFRAQRGCMAELKDFVFEGITYQVASFTIVASGKGFEESGFQTAEVSGAYFNGEAQSLLKKCQAGTTVTVDDINVIGPGGIKRKIEGNVTYVLE